MTLRREFLALTYLLRNACNARRRLSNNERLLWIYFHAFFLVLILAHAVHFKERPLVLKLSAILEYFANVLGERLNKTRFGDMNASDFLMSL